jgi:hypothetical protein
MKPKGGAMIYQRRVEQVEAVLLTDMRVGLEFLKCGEFSVIDQNGFHLVVDGGTIFAPYGETYLVRQGDFVYPMPKPEFEQSFEEA